MRTYFQIRGLASLTIATAGFEIYALQEIEESFPNLEDVECVSSPLQLMNLRRMLIGLSHCSPASTEELLRN